ncbi:putative ankyrin repeat protein [Acanthamoeba polyphaga mimivirus]|uniref:Ankyrin repeat protein n=1 Tax=Acanthamoeba polyphaga mimivirus Kroon TaxID=3069720 RepID=A0A0G2Y9P8_9VIRU|nr:putative ankyrin repeat protein [Acanthamoeba polyphaga mimivirus]AKI80567.1 putative ankyrin repeat protein [Acanthamoeba polyphaga mimivirus Kroon]
MVINKLIYSAMNNITPLMLAVSNYEIHDNYDTVKSLIDSGFNVNAVDKRGRSVLMYAIGIDSDKNINVIRLLLEHGADVNHVDLYQKSVLIHACLYMDYGYNNKTISLLIDKGADINYICGDKNIFMMIHKHLSEETFQEIFYLIDNNTNVNYNYSNNIGENILMRIIKKLDNKYSIVTIKLLLEHGINIEHVNIYGQTALMYACNYISKIDNMPIIKLLLDYGADINSKCNKGWSPLMSVFKNDVINIKTIKFLVKKGADINAKNHKNETMLYVLCKKLPTIIYRQMYVKIFAYLIKKGILINYPNYEGYTPLMIYIIKTSKYFKNTENIETFMKLLLDHGANINAKNVFGSSILNKICNDAVSDLNHNIEIINILIKYGADINSTTLDHGTILMNITHNINNKHYTTVLKLLLKNGANPNIYDKKYHKPPLLINILNTRNDFKIVKLMLRYNADPNIVDNNGNNALLFAAKYFKGNERLPILKLLLIYGADYNCINKRGKSFSNYILDNEVEYYSQIIAELSKNNKIMKNVINSIPVKVPKKLYSLESFKMKIIRFKWKLRDNFDKIDFDCDDETITNYLGTKDPIRLIQIIDESIKYDH